MQVITDLVEATDFIKNLTQSLSDLAYWKDWSALFITSRPELDWIKQGKITVALRSQMPKAEGSVLWLKGSLVVIFSKQDSFDAEAFSETLASSLNLKDINVERLSIDQDTQRFSALLAERTGRSYGYKSVSQPGFAFLKSMLPNIEELFHEWHQSKHVRESRDKPLLMIVDDDLMTLRLVSQALEKQKYTVATAQSGAEAIAKHLQLKPDIVFLDIGMPDCDGLTVLNYIQQYDKDCRIVMFSADDFLKTRLKAFASGAKGFLTKPFNLQGFQKQIAQWIAPSGKG